MKTRAADRATDRAANRGSGMRVRAQKIAASRKFSSSKRTAGRLLQAGGKCMQYANARQVDEEGNVWSRSRSDGWVRRSTDPVVVTTRSTVLRSTKRPNRACSIARSSSCCIPRTGSRRVRKNATDGFRYLVDEGCIGVAGVYSSDNAITVARRERVADSAHQLVWNRALAG